MLSFLMFSPVSPFEWPTTGSREAKWEKQALLGAQNSKVKSLSSKSHMSTSEMSGPDLEHIPGSD